MSRQRALLAEYVASRKSRMDAARKRKRAPRRPSALPLAKVLVRSIRSWANETERTIAQLFDYWRTVHLPGLQRADAEDDDRLTSLGAADLLSWLRRTLFAATGSFWLRGAQVDPARIPRPVDPSEVEAAGRAAASLSHSESLSMMERAGADPAKLRREIAARAGIKISSSPSNIINLAPTDLHRAEIDRFVRANVDLITKIPRSTLAAMDAWLADNLIEGARPGDIAAGLVAKLGISETRAMLIARDQIGKLNGQINETNQLLAGVDSYVWVDMDDERVRGKPGGKYPRARPSHHALNGKVFRWSEPPVSGHGGQRLHPGQPIQCRCYPDPRIPADITAD